MKHIPDVGIILLIVLLFYLFSPELYAQQKFSIFPEGEKPSGFVFTISIFFAFIVALGVHELGHLITGLVQGFRFELFVIFLLGIKRTEKGIVPFLNRNIGYMGGVAATIPTTKDSETRKRFAYMVLAGPLASLAFTVICFLFLFYTQDKLWSFWLFSASISFGLFLATTIPKKTGMYFTDRARFQRLISKGPEGRSEEALLQILAQTTVDNTFKNINLTDARTLQQDTEPFMQFWGYFYEFRFSEANGDCSNADAAKVKLKDLKRIISPPVWKALKIEE